MRSGLDAQERNAILAKTNDSLKQVDVESALTRLWMDYDLRERERERDQKKGVSVQRGFLAAESDGDESTAEHATEEQAMAAGQESETGGSEFDMEEYDSRPEFGFTIKELSDKDGREEAESAMMNIKTAKNDIKRGRRMLATARATVREIRRNRGFYPKKQIKQQCS